MVSYPNDGNLILSISRWEKVKSKPLTWSKIPEGIKVIYVILVHIKLFSSLHKMEFKAYKTCLESLWIAVFLKMEPKRVQIIKIGN
jgi:hypothetical protein